MGTIRSRFFTVGKQYQSERATHEQIEAWFTQWPDMNIGIVSGAISGIAVVDIEAGGSTERFPPTATSKTGGGGFHLVYTHPGHDVKNGVRVAELTDIRGDRGYFVAPPSISEKGGYEWVVAPWDVEMAEYPAELVKSFRKPEEKKRENLLQGIVHVGERNDTATRFAGSILAALPPGLWGIAGWGALKEWNATQTESPLEERELRTVFESIRGREAATRTSSAEQAILLNPFTLARLFEEEFPPTLWLAKDLIPLGGVAAITGDSNTYKSFLTLALSASVANGQPFLGHFDTQKGKVLIIDEENHRRVTRKHFEDMGIEPTEDILFLSQTGIKLDKENYAKALRDVLDKERPALVVLDSLVRFHSKEENSATEMSQVMNEIKKLVADDRAVVVVHHHKKEQGFPRRGGGQSVRGSSDIFASLDCHLSVERKEKEGHLILNQNKLRVQRQLEPFKVGLVMTENGGISFIYDGVDTTRKERVLEVAENIKTLLATSTEPLSLKTLRDEIGNASKSVVAEALKVLLASGEILSSRRDHGAYYYELAPAETEQEKEDDDW